MTAPTPWMSVSERGGRAGLRFVVFLCRVCGRRVARAFVSFLAAWYFLFDGHIRRASRGYLSRLNQGAVSRRQIYRHIRAFACVTLDRLFFAIGETRAFQVEFHGEEHLIGLREAGQGALLILAHVGSFEAGRALASERRFAINVLGNFHNAQQINAVLEELNPDINTRLLDIGAPGDIDFVFKAEDRLAHGELLATMGDRVGADGKQLRVDFLGASAALPTGPYLLAAALRCPVYLAFGIFSEPNRYDLYCEPFAERIELNRRDRNASLRRYLTRYAERLEAFCRLAPLNWFNFYDFWSAPSGESPGPASPPAAEGGLDG